MRRFIHKRRRGDAARTYVPSHIRVAQGVSSNEQSAEERKKQVLTRCVGRVESLRGVVQVGGRAGTDNEPLQEHLKTWLDACPADTLVLVDQPGVSSEDFKLTAETAALWTQLVRYLNRCATLMPFLQTPAPLDLGRIAQHYIAACEAEVVEVDLRKENPEQRLFPHYIDTRRRIIRVRFPALPDDPEERLDVLFENDLVIHDIIKATPSPFFAILYTNSDGADTSAAGPAGPYGDYYLVDKLVKASQDPKNRDLWKKHAGPAEGQFLGGLGPMKPPHAKYVRSQASRRAAESASHRAQVESGSEGEDGLFDSEYVTKAIEVLSQVFQDVVSVVDAELTVPRIVLFVSLSILTWLVMGVFKLFAGFFATPTTGSEAEKPEEQASDNDAATDAAATAVKNGEQKGHSEDNGLRLRRTN